ncbi:hypothetical protein AMTR_s00001p00263190 [Amborella trichopoda]|uniref:Uncharacterized protein n=1 Tax=Amborella trichopoda TaxID=13333 RepID=W1NMJ8_AMBTC|nr:hypothetical protein AMTR_s00001p00263190 [Amborella trichopoda]
MILQDCLGGSGVQPILLQRRIVSRFLAGDALGGSILSLRTAMHQNACSLHPTLPNPQVLANASHRTNGGDFKMSIRVQESQTRMTIHIVQ